MKIILSVIAVCLVMITVKLYTPEALAYVDSHNHNVKDIKDIENHDHSTSDIDYFKSRVEKIIESCTIKDKYTDWKSSDIRKIGLRIDC